MKLEFRSNADVVIRTQDWDQAQAFYSKVLGLQRTHASESLVGYDTGAFRLYVEPGPAHGPIFELLVADVEAAKQQLFAAGCVLVEEDPKVPRCYVRDPYGLVFNLGKAATA